MGLLNLTRPGHKSTRPAGAAPNPSRRMASKDVICADYTPVSERSKRILCIVLGRKLGGASSRRAAHWPGSMPLYLPESQVRDEVNYRLVSIAGLGGEKNPSISSRVLPLVSGIKNVTVMKYSTVKPAKA